MDSKITCLFNSGVDLLTPRKVIPYRYDMYAVRPASLPVVVTSLIVTNPYIATAEEQAAEGYLGYTELHLMCYDAGDIYLKVPYGQSVTIDTPFACAGMDGSMIRTDNTAAEYLRLSVYGVEYPYPHTSSIDPEDVMIGYWHGDENINRIFESADRSLVTTVFVRVIPDIVHSLYDFNSISNYNITSISNPPKINMLTVVGGYAGLIFTIDGMDHYKEIEMDGFHHAFAVNAECSTFEVYCASGTMEYMLTFTRV